MWWRSICWNAKWMCRKTKTEKKWKLKITKIIGRPNDDDDNKKKITMHSQVGWWITCDSCTSHENKWAFDSTPCTATSFAVFFLFVVFRNAFYHFFLSLFAAEQCLPQIIRVHRIRWDEIAFFTSLPFNPFVKHSGVIRNKITVIVS
jgi:hypothetical protein